MSTPSDVEAFVSATLYLTSRELTPAIMTERIGLVPTSTRLKGEPISERHPEIGRDPYNYFILEVRRAVHHTGARFTDDSAAQLLRTAIEELLGKLEPAVDRLNSLRHQVSASLICVYGALPAPQWVILPDTLLSRLAELKLSVKIFLAPLEGGEMVSKEQREA